MLKKEIAQVEHWFHTEAERFMLRHLWVCRWQP